MAMALLIHGLVQFGDGLVAVERFGRHWLLGSPSWARCSGEHPMAMSAVAGWPRKLAAVHGHARLDWVMLLDPVATDVLSCWQVLAHHVEAPQQGQAPIAIGQVIRSDGLSLQRLQSSLWSTGDAGGSSALAAVPKPSGLVGTPASTAIRTTAADHRNMAGLQAFRIAATLASEACSGFPGRRPLNCVDA